MEKSEVSNLCGRYWIAPEADSPEYAALLRALSHRELDISWPSGMIVPTLPAPAMTHEGLKLMRFGMKKSFLPKILINARSESLTDKPMFKRLFAKGQRCLLPASAFYEPSPDKKGRKFQKPDGGLLYLAGLYDENEEKEDLPQFVIITRDADEVVAPSHSRMPVLLNNDELRQIWLDDEVLAASLLTLQPGGTLLEMSVI